METLRKDRLSPTPKASILVATDLIYSLSRLRNHEISEIRYLCSIDWFIRIYLDEKEKLTGEYFCKSRASLEKFREKLGLSK